MGKGRCIGKTQKDRGKPQDSTLQKGGPRVGSALRDTMENTDSSQLTLRGLAMCTSGHKMAAAHPQATSQSREEGEPSYTPFLCHWRRKAFLEAHTPVFFHFITQTLKICLLPLALGSPL